MNNNERNDTNSHVQDAVRVVTDTPAQSGESLIGSPELRKRFREAKARLKREEAKKKR